MLQSVGNFSKEVDVNSRSEFCNSDSNDKECISKMIELFLVIKKCREKLQCFTKGQEPLEVHYLDKLEHVQVLKSASAQYYHCINLHMCPHYQVSKRNIRKLSRMHYNGMFPYRIILCQNVTDIKGANFCM